LKLLNQKRGFNCFLYFFFNYQPKTVLQTSQPPNKLLSLSLSFFFFFRQGQLKEVAKMLVTSFNSSTPVHITNCVQDSAAHAILNRTHAFLTNLTANLKVLHLHCAQPIRLERNVFYLSLFGLQFVAITFAGMQHHGCQLESEGNDYSSRSILIDIAATTPTLYECFHGHSNVCHSRR
jgi:hypothetical protein